MTMLDRMRRHKGWLKWFLALVAVALCLYLVPDFLSGGSTTSSTGAAANEVIASVGGRRVTVRDFDLRYQSQLERFRAQFGGSVDDNLLRQLGIEQQVLRQLVEEHITAIEAERQGIRVSDEELATQIVSLPLFQENGQFVGDQRYRQTLQSFNPPLTVPQFEDEMRRGIALDRLRSALTDWVAVSDADVEREYKLRNEKVELQVVALTAERFRDKVTVSDADVAAHFDARKDDYRVGESRRIRYFLMDRDLARLKVTVTPNEIQRDYNDNIARYHTPEQVRASHILLGIAGKDEADVRSRAEALLAQVKGGADFAALAKKVSEDEGTKANGGDLNFFSRGQMVPEFEAAAFAMQPGETSDVVRSEHGFHIIRVTDRRAEETRPLDQVRAEIQERITLQKALRILGDQAAKLSAEIDTASDLDRGAAQVGAKVETSDFFTRQDPVPGLGMAPQVADAAFRLKTTSEVAGPLETSRGIVFLALAETRDAYVPEFDDVKDRAREDLIRARAADLGRQRAGEIAESLRRARDFGAAAKSLGLEARETALIARGSVIPDVGASPEVDAVVFSLPAGGVSGPITANDTTIIAKVVERDDVTPDELARDRDAFRAELVNERRDRFFSAYMTKARDRTTVEINNEVMRRALSARGL